MRYGPLDILDELLTIDERADPEVTYAIKPFLIAVRQAPLQIIKLLLSRGSSFYIKHSGLEYALLASIESRRPAVAAAILDAGQQLNVDVLIIKGSAATYTTPLIEAVSSGDLRIVRLMLNRGANASMKSWHRSPLSEAMSRYGLDSEISLSLIEAGAQIGLSECILANDLDRAKKLLDAGANVDTCDSQRQTLLAWAAMYGRTDAVKLLMSHRADPNVRSSNVITALMRYSGPWDPDFADSLIKQGALVCREAPVNVTYTDLAVAAGLGHTDAVSWFLQRFGLDADKGWKALILASSNGHADVCRLLLAAGVDPNANTQSREFRTALIESVLSLQLETSRMLLEHGANINERDCYGRSAIFYPASAGSKSLLRLLLEFRPSQMEIDKALKQAVYADRPACADILIKAGARPY
jgi:ankyrin repeat protein